ncbi:MAG: sn-glycerol-3-phosphate ABC transporter ATP-binding protein UgpC [Clostridiales bacterium]|nr:sn-glycerol-3-phosphate ABC transporter ATP-binding protein UgpC [Clostridiales bacterium]
MASISLKGVTKVYPGNVKAIDNFNLEIIDKEFIIFVGPSGCGKSTTLRMIAGLEDITEGELFINDRKVNDVPPKDRDIAMVFQNYALYPHMTVFKNMAFALKLRKVPKDVISQKVHEAAHILDIERLLDRKPKALSGGERQRVALGRAMVRDPAVFLLDEPLSNLDAKLRTAMRSEISKLHKQLATTFVYVTHDQTEAMTMGDRIVVMKGGIIQQIDTPQNLYDSPCNIFVAGFIGTPQMNFLSAVVEKHGGGYVAKCCGTAFPLLTVPEETIAEYAGREVTLGIRPEDIHLEPEYMANPELGVITANLELSEMMGSEIYLYLNCEGNKLIGRVPSRFGAQTDSKMTLGIDCEKLHVFDPATDGKLGL